jgi:hypothetical protein
MSALEFARGPLPLGVGSMAEAAGDVPGGVDAESPGSVSSTIGERGGW